MKYLDLKNFIKNINVRIIIENNDSINNNLNLNFKNYILTMYSQYFTDFLISFEK